MCQHYNSRTRKRELKTYKNLKTRDSEYSCNPGRYRVKRSMSCVVSGKMYKACARKC